jgi:hypothetical protein
MIIKTKRYQLETKTYITLSMKNIALTWWWAFLVPLAFVALSVVFSTHWFWAIGLTLLILYILFWLIQFTGITQLEQYKMLFDKLQYEIDSRQILIKINTKQGMPIPWEKVEKVRVGKDDFQVFVTKAQLVYLPHKIFNNVNEIKFFESILKRKGLMKE